MIQLAVSLRFSTLPESFLIKFFNWRPGKTLLPILAMTGSLKPDAEPMILNPVHVQDVGLVTIYIRRLDFKSRYCIMAVRKLSLEWHELSLSPLSS